MHKNTKLPAIKTILHGLNEDAVYKYPNLMFCRITYTFMCIHRQFKIVNKCTRKFANYLYTYILLCWEYENTMQSNLI